MKFIHLVLTALICSPVFSTDVSADPGLSRTRLESEALKACGPGYLLGAGVGLLYGVTALNFAAASTLQLAYPLTLDLLNWDHDWKQSRKHLKEAKRLSKEWREVHLVGRAAALNPCSHAMDRLADHVRAEKNKKRNMAQTDGRKDNLTESNTPLLQMTRDGVIRPHQTSSRNRTVSKIN